MLAWEAAVEGGEKEGKIWHLITSHKSPTRLMFTLPTRPVFTYFAVFSCNVSWALAVVLLVCKSTQTCSIIKARITGTRVLIRTKDTQLELWSINKNTWGLKEFERAICPLFENVFLRRSYKITSSSWNHPHNGTIWDYNILRRSRASHKIASSLLYLRVLSSHVWKKRETAGSLRSCYPSFKLQELSETEYKSLTSVPV